MRRRLAATAVLVVALAGCGQGRTAGGSAPEPTGTPEVHQVWRSCEQDKPPTDPATETGHEALALPRLGAGFDPVALTLCGTQHQDVPGGGEDLVAVEQRSESIDELVTALRLPSQPRTDGACVMAIFGVPWFVLHDAQGRWLRPGVPSDSCGQPRIEVRQAIDKLQLTTVSTRKIREITSGEADRAGCSQGWADLVSVVAADGTTAAPPNTYVPPVGATVRLCVYEVPLKQQGTGKPAGDFVKGGPLAPDKWAAIRSALPVGAPAEPCRKHANGFAVLHVERAGEIYVELDGCHRVHHSNARGLAQAQPALAAAIDRALP